MSEIKLHRFHCANLTIDGKAYRVERIGKGRYSTAWRSGDTVFVQTSEKDYGKELLCYLSGTPHLPTIEAIGSHGAYNWYKMPFYRKLTTRSTGAWADFRYLQELQKTAEQMARRTVGFRNDDHYPHICNHNLVELVEGAPILAPRYSDSLAKLSDWCCNYGQSWLIETLQPRNCAVDSHGELILLDPVFDLAELRADQDRKAKAARGY
jgi:hypothetical protein